MHLLIDRDGPIVTLTMNRPEVRNALSKEMLQAMADAWEMINVDKSVRVAILTGAGQCFTSGADLTAMAATKDRSDEMQHLAFRALLRNYKLSKPLIAAVEGYAVAGGTEILLSADIRIAGESAQFGIPEVKRGLFPQAGSTVRLSRQISFTNAMELLLTGELIDARKAMAIGLIGRVVSDGSALQEASSIAERICQNAPLSVQAIKRSVIESIGLSEDEALRNELEIGAPIFQSADAHEGALAFTEKRRPRYSGH